MFNTDKIVALLKILILTNKILPTLALDTILGDPCICDGRCKECVLALTHKSCKLCTGFYGLDFKNLGIDSLGADNELQVPRRTCVCPADFRQISSDNRSSSEIIFVKLECGVEPVEKRFCVGINPELFLIGSNFAEYWIIIGSILSIVFILCCALYSLFKNNWCFAPENLMNIYAQNFPLSTIGQSRGNSFQSFNTICVDNNQISVDMRSDSSHPPTYDEIFNICSNSNQINNSDKRFIDLSLYTDKDIENDILPTYEDVMAKDQEP